MVDPNDSLTALDGHMQLDGVAQVEETYFSGDSVGLKGAWEERMFRQALALHNQSDLRWQVRSTM